MKGSNCDGQNSLFYLSLIELDIQDLISDNFWGLNYMQQPENGYWFGTHYDESLLTVEMLIIKLFRMLIK